MYINTWKSWGCNLSNEVFLDFFGHLQRFLEPLKNGQKWTFFTFLAVYPGADQVPI